MAIISSNNPILFPVELAIGLKKGISVSIYETDSPETIFYKLNLTKTETLVCDKSNFNKIKNLELKNKTDIKQIMLLEDCDIPKSFEEKNEIKIEKVWPEEINFKEVLEEEKIRVMISKITKNDIVRIIFTSGTTGPQNQYLSLIIIFSQQSEVGLN